MTCNASEFTIKNGVLLKCHEQKETIIVPDGVTQIGGCAFEGFLDTKQIILPDGLIKIGWAAFRRCKSLKSITIPASVTTIERSAFADSGIEHITLPPGLREISEELFRYSEIREITIPEGVRKIGSDAFESCRNLEKVALPESLKEIWGCAFASCERLKQINLPETTTVWGNAFGMCEALADENGFIILNKTLYESPAMYKTETVVVPDGVEVLNQATPSANSDIRYFDANRKLIHNFCTKLVIPESVKKYGLSAFKWGKLKTIVSCSPASFGPLDFLSCESLRNITVRHDVEISKNLFSYNQQDNEKAMKKLQISYLDTPIDHSQLSKICKTFLNITGIHSYAELMQRCSYSYSKKGSSDGLAPKENSAINAEIPRTACIQPAPVQKHVSAPTPRVSNSNTSATEDSESFTGKIAGFEIQRNVLYAYSGTDTNITIPDTVTAIDEYAFAENHKLNSVTVPSSVTSIGNSAFYDCINLTSITIPNSVSSIGEDAFKHCKKMKSLILPDSISVIEYNAFHGCSSLENISIPSSVTDINGSAFEDCRSLTSVDIPDSVTVIGASAFWNCTNLKNVVIHSKLAEIGPYAFGNCRSLTSFVIPDGIISIPSNTFDSCTSLKSIVIPGSVTSIDRASFNGCRSLTIHGKAGSFAQKYATQNEIPFLAEYTERT